MASVRFADMQFRPVEFLDFTSLTLNEFQQLVPPFEATFQAHMAAWRLDGKPRTARQFSVYKNCPLPTPEDRLFFILTYLKTYSLQVVQGRLFGMGQSKANQWIHVLLPALLAALRTLGDAPTRSLAALAQRLTGQLQVLGRIGQDGLQLVPQFHPRPVHRPVTAPTKVVRTEERGTQAAVGIRHVPVGGRVLRGHRRQVVPTCQVQLVQMRTESVLFARHPTGPRRSLKPA